MKKIVAISAATLCMSAAFLPISAFAQTADSWQFGAMLYGYFPTIGGKTTFPVSAGSDVTVDANQILDHLQGGFLGSLEARKGRWGAFTDVLYLNLGDSSSDTRNFSVGHRQIPGNATADTNFNLKGTVWTLAGTYQVLAEPGVMMDLIAGARMLKIKETLDWHLSGNIGPVPLPGRSGSSDVSDTLWDGIVGAKGRFTLGEERKWFIPYYIDVGTGQSDLTWQAMGGVGYSYGWGEVVAGWRYLDYNMKSGYAVESMSFSGPMIGALFHW